MEAGIASRAVDGMQVGNGPTHLVKGMEMVDMGKRTWHKEAKE